jgi:tetratricopeptide (TPR) repeat protein
LGLAFGTFSERGTVQEGQEWYRRVLTLEGGSPSMRALALIDFGWLALYQGNLEVALEAGARATELAPAARPSIRARALHLLGAAELDRGPSETAQGRLEEALELLRGDPEGGAVAPRVLSTLGLLAGLRHDYADARQQFEAALAALPPGTMPAVRAALLTNLSWIVREDGDQQRAAALSREVLMLDSEIRNAVSLMNSFENAADFALAIGQPEVAARLLGAAEAVRTEANVVIESFNVEEHDATLARTREALSEAAFSAAWKQGESLTLEQSIAEADAVLAQAAQADTEGDTAL